MLMLVLLPVARLQILEEVVVFHEDCDRFLVRLADEVQEDHALKGLRANPG